MGKLFHAVLTLGMMAQVAATAAEPNSDEKEELNIGHIVDWLELEPASDGEDPPGMTYSALRMNVAVSPTTGKPFAVPQALREQVSRLRRTFRLEKRDFLFGEPIAVEFRVTLEGPGEWHEHRGGNYRSRGRDDNFLFVMRHEDGTWISDPLLVGSPIGGGLGGGGTTREGQSNSNWFPLQRWCALERPGRYHLYCLHGEFIDHIVSGEEALRELLEPPEREALRFSYRYQLYDTRYGKESEKYVAKVHNVDEGIPKESPLHTRIPELLVDRWGKAVTDFACLSLTIREGSEEERQAMVETYEDLALKEASYRDGRRNQALSSAIPFLRQTDFLPALRTRLETEGREQFWWLGLAMHPAPEGVALYLEHKNQIRLSRSSLWQGCFRPDASAHTMPNLIELLTHENGGVRSKAVECLRAWSGQFYLRDEDGEPVREVTLAQGRKVQPLWRAWWDENKEGFIAASFPTNYGFIDREGNLVIEPTFDEAEEFADGRARVRLRCSAENQWALIDRTGAVVWDHLPEDQRSFAEGLRLMREDGMWGYENEDGELAIPAQYTYALPFSEGLAAVRDPSTATYGYIDRNGKWVIKPRFHRANRFRGGLASASVAPKQDGREGLAGIIDKAGKWVVRPAFAHFQQWPEPDGSFFSDGLACVAVKPGNDHPDEGNPTNHKYGYIDKTGDMVIPAQFSYAHAFREGYAAVRSGNKWGFIDTTGAYVTEPWFDSAESFSEGLAAVRMGSEKDGEWGFVDKKGTLVVPLQFKAAGSFSEGLAAVAVGPRYVRGLKEPDATAAKAGGSGVE